MSPALAPQQLRRSLDLNQFEFETTADLPTGAGIIGQPRGVQGIEFGINMASPGYNIYVLGESGTGRTTAIQRYVEARAGTDPVPSDWAYVYNFREPHRPWALPFPAGVACGFRDALQKLINQLRNDISRAFDNQVFRDAALEVQHELEAKREQLFTDLQGQASQQGAALLSSPEGFTIVPLRDGQPISAEQYAQFAPEEKTAWRETRHGLQHQLNEVIHQARGLEKEAQEGLVSLSRRVAGSVVDGAMVELKQQYEAVARVGDYLDAVHQDILDNVDHFRADVPDKEEAVPPTERFRRYQINVLVDHRHSDNAPTVVEYDPSIPRLLGRIEHEARYGGVVTDFTLIRAGALHRANGGYLVLRARDLFAEMGAWEGLKRALVGEAIRPDDPAARGGAITRSLDPEPIPLQLKVILVGPPGLYYHLYDGDEDFASIFKVMADFDEVLPRTAVNEMAYATFVATLCHEEELLHLDRAAVGRIVEYGSRLAGTQSKLSTRFGSIADLIREANYWARSSERETVTKADVMSALENRDQLRNRIEARMREHLLDGKQLVDSAGAVVGQINGLSVSRVGEHAFGHPSRVTARTYVGKAGVVAIDREVALAGPIHNKGVLTLVGYLGGHYADDIPIALSGQITFEQNYGGIDGDSASSTELYALLSSLADIPLKQAMAVTGSVNQRGEVQAIGGVTQKVEGWFAVCQARILTGEQGVIIPAANVSDLMLREPLITAVEAGQFHIWAVASIDEGIELLTGVDRTVVHTAVKKRLRELAAAIKGFGAAD